MLASMYDASLDQFKPHNWYDPSFWPTYSNYSRWNGNYNFIRRLNLARKRIRRCIIVKELIKNYDSLMMSCTMPA